MGAGQLAAVLAREVVSIRRAGFCVHKTVRNVTEAEKKEVMQRYGLPESDLAKVAIDHFITMPAIFSCSPKHIGPAAQR